MPVQPAIERTITLKPIFLSLIHSAAYEGPCRVGKLEDLTPEAEKRQSKERFEKFKNTVESELGDHVNLLEAETVTWGDDFVVPDSEVAKLADDAHRADVILFGHNGLPQYPAIQIAETYQTPALTVGQVGVIDITAGLRARGLEAHTALSYEDLREVLDILRVRKALRNTRALVALMGNVVPTGVVSSIQSIDSLRQNLGMEYRLIPAEEVLQARLDLSDEQAAKAEQITRTLQGNAEESDMTDENLLPSVQFYLAVDETLRKYEANAFTIPCFEICATQRMQREKVGFCLAHSLLKDRGIPSACEGDVNVLLAIATLMNMAKKSVFMGNAGVRDVKANRISVSHDVPGLKMKGFDEPDLPYGIKNFTTGGWGATIRYDISRDVGEPVTMLRYSPHADAMMAVAGEVVGCEGYMKVGCSMRYDFEIADARAFHEHTQRFGHHFGVVFGEYTKRLERLSELLGLDIVTI